MATASDLDRHASINANFARIAAEAVPVISGAQTIQALRAARHAAADALVNAPGSLSCMDAFNAALNAISDASMARHRALRIQTTQGESV